MNNKILYDFDGFRVDTDQKCLWRGEDIVSLTPKAFETLLVLIKNKGNVVAKNSILDEVWKDTFVEEATLAQNISTLRKTLAKYEKGKEFIVTIPRRGYRFVVDVTEINADEEVLIVEKHSVTHIVAEQEKIINPNETLADNQEDFDKIQSSLSKKLLIGLPITLLVLLTMGVIASFYYLNSDNFYNSKFQKFQVNNLLSSGRINGVMASPDGKYIVTIQSNNDGDTISLKQVNDGNSIKVLPKSNLQIIGTTFSPKGDYIYFTAYKREVKPVVRYGKLYKIPVLGGASQEVLNDIDSPVAISSNNEKLAYVRNKLDKKQSVIIISNADGSDEKELAIRDLQNSFSIAGMSFSPDGKMLSSVVFDRENEKIPTQLVIINTENGEIKSLTKDSWLWIGKPIWLKDGSGLAFVAYGLKSPNLTDEIWFVSYPSGESKVITNGIKGVLGINITENNNSIIATKMNRITSSYVAPIDDLDNANEINKTADEVSLLQLGTDWTKDDEKIIYAKTQNGNADIWSMNIDGNSQIKLTADPSADFAPVISEDGNFIYFLSNRAGSTSIWRMDIDGKNPFEIVKAGSLFAPTLSPNNDYIYYSAKSIDKQYNVLWKADFDGKNANPITDVRTYGGKISPDGKHIICFYPDTNEDPDDISKPLKLTVLSTEDLKVVKQFEALSSRNLPTVKWNKDSQSFLILKRNVETSTLSRQQLGSDEPQILKEWNDENVYQIAISRDGKKLFFEKGKEVNSVIQLKNMSE